MSPMMVDPRPDGQHRASFMRRGCGHLGDPDLERRAQEDAIGRALVVEAKRR